MTTEHDLEEYLSLIRAFTDGQLPASEFMHEYLELFKYDEEKRMSDDAYNVLNTLFFAVEVYCEDPELRGEDDIGEEQFFKEAAYARRDLENQLREQDGTE